MAKQRLEAGGYASQNTRDKCTRDKCVRERESHP